MIVKHTAQGWDHRRYSDRLCRRMLVTPAALQRQILWGVACLYYARYPFTVSPSGAVWSQIRRLSIIATLTPRQ